MCREVVTIEPPGTSEQWNWCEGATPLSHYLHLLVAFNSLPSSILRVLSALPVSAVYSLCRFYRRNSLLKKKAESIFLFWIENHRWTGCCAVLRKKRERLGGDPFWPRVDLSGVQHSAYICGGNWLTNRTRGNRAWEEKPDSVCTVW